MYHINWVSLLVTEEDSFREERHVCDIFSYFSLYQRTMPLHNLGFQIVPLNNTHSRQKNGCCRKACKTVRGERGVEQKRG